MTTAHQPPNPLAALIAEAVQLSAAATPGPWVVDERYPGYVYCDDAVGSAVALPPSAPVLRESLARLENAAFIARARTLIPELAAALEQQGVEMAELRAEIQQLRENT